MGVNEQVLGEGGNQMWGLLSVWAMSLVYRISSGATPGKGRVSGVPPLRFQDMVPQSYSGS